MAVLEIQFATWRAQIVPFGQQQTVICSTVLFYIIVRCSLCNATEHTCLSLLFGQGRCEGEWCRMISFSESWVLFKMVLWCRDYRLRWVQQLCLSLQQDCCVANHREGREVLWFA